MRPDVEQGNVLVLARHVHHAAQHLLQDPHGAQRPVHEYPAPPAPRNHPPNEKVCRPLAPRLWDRQTGRREPGEHRVRLRELEEGLDKRLLGSLPQNVGADPSAEHEVERVHEQGLAGPGLAGEHVQPRAEPDLDLVHHRETRDPQRRQHGRELATGG